MGISKELLIDKIIEAEHNGNFHEHVEPIDFSSMVKVTGDHEYLPNGFKAWIVEKVVRIVAIILAFFINTFGMGMRVKGKGNLKGIKGTIVTCNHVNDIDVMMVRQAVFGHRLYITGGEFNNKKGAFGAMLRAAGTLPFSSNIKAMKKLGMAINKILNGKNAILFFPEESSWWRYEKPRPFRNGAFYYATVNNKPIVPIFITFHESKGLGKYFRKHKTATLNILSPLYPRDDLDKQANIAYLKEQNFLAYKEVYESVYKRPLTYSTNLKDKQFNQ
jgi:1-acyl-sn-glycerol-3-phosphate acyltransferase